MIILAQTALIFITSCVVYSGVATSPFLYDDTAALLNNPDVQGNTTLSSLLMNDFWGVPLIDWKSHKSYRPLTVLYFRCLHSIWGNWATPFHISNIVLHAVVSILFFLVCRKHAFSKDQKQAPFVAGLLFSLHPIHTEAVCGIVGCAELLSAICFMLALLFNTSNFLSPSDPHGKTQKRYNAIQTDTATKNSSHIKGGSGMRRRKHKNDSISDSSKQEISTNEENKNDIVGPNHTLQNFSIIYSLLFAALAMLCKESGISVLGVLITCEAIASHAKKKEHRSPRFWCFDLAFLAKSIAICITGLSLFIFRMWFMDWKQPTFQDYDNPTVNLKDRSSRAMTYFSLCWVNFGLLLYPVNLCYDYSYPTIPLITSVWDRRNIISFAFLLLCIICGIIITKSFKSKNNLSRSFVIGWALMGFSFLPASNLFFPVGFVIAERCLYLPSSGFIVLIVWFSCCVERRYPSLRSLLCVALASTVVIYFAFTARRSLDWTSKERLFRSGVEVNPKSAKILQNWGNYLLAMNLTKEAEAAFNKSVQLNPKYHAGLHNLGVCKQKNKETWDEALDLFKRVIKIKPGGVKAYLNMALIFIGQERFQNASDSLLRAIRQGGGDDLHHIGTVARKLLDKNQLSEAKLVYSKLLKRVCSGEDYKSEFKDCPSDYSQALKEYKFIVRKEAEENHSETMEALGLMSNDADELLNYAKRMLSVGDVESATNMMLKTVEKSSSKIYDLWKMAHELFVMRRFNESARLYKHLASTLPNDLNALGLYAGSLVESGKVEEGEKMLLNLTLRDHNCLYVKNFINLASIYGRKSKHKEAIDMLNTCLLSKRTPQNSIKNDEAKSKILIQLAKHGYYLYKILAVNSKNEAMDLWRKSLKHIDDALKLNPSNTNALDIKKKLEEEKGNWI